ncbi:hypothetical protein AMJ39_03070 [candidate division TA06 bacterium DG_24]|uniref:Aminopeptidase n=3 Tax=Bacteria division TA06 TaxID=1156500 RepID=A0A0S8J7V2_UNCT6|nr:MAG: hypothetical protein AMJ39_03070 [candidate division TA06 bacterium DG_24]KPK70748.1 MAG: hypothetical protein AMJ82_02285 [candidate division TA06 bacterium SM23_40]KPL05830.1 MAG: hypothetical protein AMJ71_10740 [candidate division TA06 bacterium SM1_40]
MRELLKRLSDCYGPSGEEALVREVVRKEIARSVDEIRTDVMGNLIARRRGRGRRIMLTAHMDESGIVVTHIDAKGFVRFAAVGSLESETLPGARVILSNGTRGTIGLEGLGDEKARPTLEKMYLDVGAADAKSAGGLVSVGDCAVLDGEATDLGGRIVGKALGARVGCAMLIEAAKRVRGAKNDLYFVLAVQGALGGRGVITSAYSVDPEIGMAVDVSPTGDTPEGQAASVQLGKGPAIKVKDAGIVSHPKVRQLLIDGARRRGIPYQLEISDGRTAGGQAMQATRSGVPTGVISVPCRYVHTPSEMVDLGDIEGGVRLLLYAMTADMSRLEL